MRLSKRYLLAAATVRMVHHDHTGGAGSSALCTRVHSLTRLRSAGQMHGMY
jgi:hypothetical protein